MRLTRWTVACTALAFALGACAWALSPADVGYAATDAAADIVASDVQTADADAAAEASDGGRDARGLFRCADWDAWFCDDFDRDGGLDDPGFWTRTLPDAGTLGLVASDAAPSAPNVYVASGDAASAVYVYKQRFVVGVTSMRCEFDMRARAAAVSTAVFAILTLSDPQSQIFQASFRTVSGDFAFYETGSVDAGIRQHFASVGGAAPSNWTHLAVDVTVGPSASLQVEVNGAPLAINSPNDLSVFTSIDRQVLSLGLVTKVDETDWTAEFDNVICWAR